ncbi:unnamed protein product, partial [Polarella glacialis]
AQVDIDEEAEQRAKNLRNLDAMLREMRAGLAEEDSDCGPDDFIRRMEDVDGELSEDEIEQQPVVFSFGMPPLQSVLARWAKAQVDFDDEAEQRAKNLGALDAMLREMRSDLAEEDSDCGPDDFIRRMEDVDGELSEDEIEQQPVVFSFGMPPLQSVLARWAKAQVDFDDEAEQQPLRRTRGTLMQCYGKNGWAWPGDRYCGPDDSSAGWMTRRRISEDVDDRAADIVFSVLARWAKAQIDFISSIGKTSKANLSEDEIEQQQLWSLLRMPPPAQVDFDDEAEQRAKNLGDLDAMLREMRSDLAEEDSDCGPDDFIRRMEDVDGELSEDEIEQQPVVFSFGMPPLLSVLARWAKAQVDFDDEAEQRAKNLGDLDAMLREMRSDLAEEDSDCGPDDFIRRMEDVDGELSEDEIEQQPVVFSFGMPPLLSVLARWAKAQVDFDDEAEQRAKNLGDLDAMLREMRSDLAEEDSDCGPDDFIRRMEDVDGELSEDEIEQQPVVFSFGMPPLLSVLARWAKAQVDFDDEAEQRAKNLGDLDAMLREMRSDLAEEDSDCGPDDFIRRMEDVDGELSEDEIEQQPVVFSFGMPPLQSVLARWAKAQVDFDDEAEQRAKNLGDLDAMLREMRSDLAEEDSDCGPDDFIRRMEDVDGELSEDEIEQQPVVFSFGMPPLQSVLARWAKAQVDFDDEAEQRAKNLGDLDAMLREMRSGLAEEDSDCRPRGLHPGMTTSTGELKRGETEQHPFCCFIIRHATPPAQVDFDDEAEQRAKNLGDLDAMLREMRSGLAEEDSDCRPDDFIRRMEDVDGELSEDEIDQQPVVFSFGMPPLQSVLARWAKAQVDFDDEAEQRAKNLGTLMQCSGKCMTSSAGWKTSTANLARMRSSSNQLCSPSACHPLLSVLARWAKAQVDFDDEAEHRAKNLGDLDAMLREMLSDLAEEDSDCGPDDFIRRMEDVDGELSEDEIEQQPVVFSFGMPPLLSVLARWAKAQVDFDDEAEQRAKNLGDLDAMLREMLSDLAEEDSDCGPDDFIRRMEDVDGELSEDEIEQQPVVFSFGMPPLLSVLARWAKAQVDFDDEAEQRAKNLGDLDAMLREMRSDLAEEAEVEEYVLVSGDNAVPSFTSRLAAFFSLQPCLEGLSVCMSPRDNHHQVQ